MSQRKVLYQWTAMVSNHFAELSLAQVKTLAAFSLVVSHVWNRRDRGDGAWFGHPGS